MSELRGSVILPFHRFQQRNIKKIMLLQNSRSDTDFRLIPRQVYLSKFVYSYIFGSCTRQNHEKIGY